MKMAFFWYFRVPLSETKPLKLGVYSVSEGYIPVVNAFMWDGTRVNEVNRSESFPGMVPPPSPHALSALSALSA